MTRHRLGKEIIIRLLVVTALWGSLLAVAGCGTVSDGAKAQPAANQSETAANKQQALDKEKQEVAKAVALMQEKDYAAAVKEADVVLAKSPTNASAHSVKGMSLALEGDTSDGLKEVLLADKLRPNDAANDYNVALVYKLQGNLTQARAWFDKVLAQDPNNVWTIYGIATIYADRGQDKEALVWLKKAVSLDPSVKEIARTQDHFERFHGQAAFEAIVK